MENTILNAYIAVATAITLGLVASVIAWLWHEDVKRKEDHLLLPVVIGLQGATVGDVPRAVAASLDNYLSRAFSPRILSGRSLLRAALLSVGVTLFAFVLGRAYSVDSFSTAVANIFTGGLAVVAFYLLLVNALFAIPSIILTRHLVRKTSRASSILEIIKYIFFDAFAAYCFVAFSLYLTAVGINPALLLADGDVGRAVDVALIMMSFEHWNAIQWPAQHLVKIDQVSTTVYALLSFVPTLLFVGLASAAVIAYGVLKALREVALRASIKLFYGRKTALAIISAALLALAGLVAAWAKVLELVSVSA